MGFSGIKKDGTCALVSRLKCVGPLEGHHAFILLPRAAVHPMCPHDGLVFPGNNHCYQLVVEKAEWLEAQQHCQEHGNGELAFVSSPEIQSFLVTHVIR